MRPLVTGLVDILFFSPDTGFAVGGNGVGNSLEDQGSSKAVILYTVDGGANWSKVYESTHVGIWCWKISFPTRQIGYVSTQGAHNAGMVLKTTDSGLSWEEIVVGDGLGFSGIGFVTPSLGWVAENQAHQTTNGGDDWQLAENVGVEINRFRFYGDTLGFAAGKTIYKYTAGSPVSVAHEPNASPSEFRLGQNYPNPFNPTTIVPLQIDEDSEVEIVIHNLLGQPIRTLFCGRQTAGTHSLSWDGKSDRGDAVASVVYLYRLRAGQNSAFRKMIFLR